MNNTILVVDDDKKTVDLIQLYLEQENYKVQKAYDGKDALLLARTHRPDLVVLDLMLPTIDGLELCRLLRMESDIPVIVLTARTTEDDKLKGLESGADDYLTKPFSPRELVARIHVVLRRAGQKEEEGRLLRRQIGSLVIDFAAHEAWLQGRLIHLTPREFKLLETLALDPGRAFSRPELISRVFGQNYEGFERTVDVHMKNLRKKIEPDPDHPLYLETVYGFGYKLRKD